MELTREIENLVEIVNQTIRNVSLFPVNQYIPSQITVLEAPKATRIPADTWIPDPLFVGDTFLLSKIIGANQFQEIAHFPFPHGFDEVV